MKILVTGPTGTQGLPVTRELIANGYDVRAFALESDPNVNKLQDLGADVFFGDLFDEESIFQALEGCEGIFFLPIVPSSGDASREIQIGKNVISASERAGVQYMVHSSVDRAGEQETFERWGPDFWPGYGAYWEGKSTVIDMVKASSIPHWAILKPAYMMDCFIPPKAWGMYPDLKKGIVASVRDLDLKVICMCGDDMGKFVADAFNHFDKYEGKELPLAGDAVSMRRAATVIAEVTGKPVVAEQRTREELLATGGRDSVIDAQEWDAVNGYTADIDYAKSFGVPLSTFEEWAERHKDEFDIQI